MTPQESIQLIDEYGVLIVIAGVFLAIMLVLFGMTVTRLKKQDNEIAPAMRSVADAQRAVANALSKSAEEKRQLKDVINNNTDAVNNIVRYYERTVEAVEKDSEFINSLKIELQSHGLQQEEILAIVRELKARA